MPDRDTNPEIRDVATWRKPSDRWPIALILLACSIIGALWNGSQFLRSLFHKQPVVAPGEQKVEQSKKVQTDKTSIKGNGNSERSDASFSAERYINIALAKQSGRTQAAILVWQNESGPSLPLLESQIANLLKVKGIEPEQSFFTPEFIDEKLAEKLFSGDWTIAKHLRMEQHVQFVLLGVAKTSFSKDETYAGLTTANLLVDLKYLDISKYSVRASKSITVSGVGYSQTEALGTSIDHAQPELEAFVSQLN